MPDYFRSSTNKAADKIVSEALTNKICNEFYDVFSGIGHFEGIFNLQVKDDSQPYKALPRKVAYVLWEHLKEELQRL